MAKCVICKKDYVLDISMYQGYGFASEASSEGIDSYDGSCFDADQFAWSQEALYIGPICDSCIENLLESKDIKLIPEEV